MNLYISDLHFGHKNIIGFDHRPFKDVDEMDHTMIQLWNGRVYDDDHVYIIGVECVLHLIGSVVICADAEYHTEECCKRTNSLDDRISIEVINTTEFANQYDHRWYENDQHPLKGVICLVR